MNKEDKEVLSKLIYRALENYELFTEVDDDGAEYFNDNFHNDILRIVKEYNFEGNRGN